MLWAIAQVSGLLNNGIRLANPFALHDDFVLCCTAGFLGRDIMGIEVSKDPNAFADFERAGWDNNITGYEDVFGPVTRQTVEATLDAANVHAGAKVLDVCTGPGMLAAGAGQRGAVPLGIDFSETVVKFAQAQVPDSEFRQADAQDLPFPDNSFDAAVCGYGLMHVPDPKIALREMKRVVRPGGRVAISSWDGSAPNNGLSLIYAAVGAHGHFDVQLPHGPDFFQFGTEDKMDSAFREIGFLDVRATPFEQYWRVNSATDLLDAIRNGTVRANALLAAQSDTAIDGILQFLGEAISGMANDHGSFDVPLPAIIGSGAKS